MIKVPPGKKWINYLLVRECSREFSKKQFSLGLDAISQREGVLGNLVSRLFLELKPESC